MKRLVGLGVILSLVGCLVGRHGHVSIFPPPALIAAAAIAATVARPGYVWVEGHWDWVGDQWVWTEGEWVAERPGFVWEQGIWINIEGRYTYRPGRWHPAHERIEVRDHRR